MVVVWLHSMKTLSLQRWKCDCNCDNLCQPTSTVHAGISSCPLCGESGARHCRYSFFHKEIVQHCSNRVTFMHLLFIDSKQHRGTKAPVCSVTAGSGPMLTSLWWFLHGYLSGWSDMNILTEFRQKKIWIKQWNAHTHAHTHTFMFIFGSPVLLGALKHRFGSYEINPLFGKNERHILKSLSTALAGKQGWRALTDLDPIKMWYTLCN